MRLLIISHIDHCYKGNFFAYAPYIREMNLWTKLANEVVVVAPLTKGLLTNIDAAYEHQNLHFEKIPSINFQSISTIFSSIFNIPRILLKLYIEMKNVDHIHLRCPGNIGLLGCIMQIFFPSKQKSAKYAGNWDPKSQQPLSYRFQKWILSNTFVTRNMTVLVYGEWPNQTKNIKSFFTATYSESDKTAVVAKIFEPTIKILFVGTLSIGKRPLYAVQLVHDLLKLGKSVQLKLYGEGKERATLENYIKTNSLENDIILMGNRGENEVRNAYKESHFLILPSKSEGWPKVVAEAMFWKCLPIATPISCVPYMLDHGNRGVLLTMELESDIAVIEKCLNSKEDYESKTLQAMEWSRHFTVDLFQEEIKNIIAR